jgi:Sulfatase
MGDSRRDLLVGGLHLGVLWAFAVAQPLLDLLGDNPDFFVARGNTRGDIILLALVLALVPPLAMLGLEALARLVDQRLRDGLHLALVGVLAAAIALQALGELATGPAAVLILAAAALGAGAAVLYARTEWLPSLLTVLSPAPILFVCLFLFFSDTKELVLPEDEVEASQVAIPGRTPVVVMLFDEFQGTMLMNAKGEIDRSLFPNFAELAERGTWYPNATTEADLTPRATPAVMTGSYPTHEELPTAADHPDSIFTLLGSDYSMNVAEPVTSVCPESLCGERARPPASERLDGLASDLRVVYEHLLLPESMEDSLPAVDENFSGFGQAEGEQAEGELQSAEADEGPGVDGSPAAGDGSKQEGAVESAFDAPNSSFLGRGNTFEEWLAKVSGQRTLNFVHLELPHVPYEFYPDGQRYAAGLLQSDGLRDSQGRNPDDPNISRLLEQRLLLQIGFTDYLLGRVIDRLKREGSWDDAIVAITADHGISLAPGQPRRVPNKTNLDEIASVPLIVKGPGMPAGRTDERQARTIDLLPTIAELLDIPAPPDSEGVSLLAPPPDRPDVIVEDRYQRVIARSVIKFERQRDAVLAQKVALFGSDQGWARVYRAGPDGNLVGRPASSVPGLAPAAAVTLAEPEQFDDVDPQARFVPGAIRARFSGLGPGVRVAFAINGRIAATTSTYEGPDGTRAFVVVPPSAFRPGANSVEVLTIEP